MIVASYSTGRVQSAAHHNVSPESRVIFLENKKQNIRCDLKGFMDEVCIDKYIPKQKQ